MTNIKNPETYLVYRCINDGCGLLYVKKVKDNYICKVCKFDLKKTKIEFVGVVEE